MKTSTITIVSLLFSLVLNAQVTLEHTYNFSGTLTEIDEDEYKYFVMDVPLKQCRIYNEDHSLYKTISLSVPEGFYLYDLKFVSRKIFNTDDDIELLFIYNKSQLVNSEYVYTYGMKVVNENGTVLMNLKDGGFAEIKTLEGEPKLLAYQYIYYDYYYLVYTNVYCLGGESSSVAAVETAPTLLIYPNPADEMVRVGLSPESNQSGGHVMVRDLSGKIMLEKSYEAGSSEIPVATGDLNTGIYIMNVIPEEGPVAAGKLAKN